MREQEQGGENKKKTGRGREGYAERQGKQERLFNLSLLAALRRSSRLDTKEQRMREWNKSRERKDIETVDCQQREGNARCAGL